MVTRESNYSDKSPFCEGHGARSSHDEMVENPHVDQSQRLFEVLREQFIGTARFRDPRRMVMREQVVKSTLARNAAAVMLLDSQNRLIEAQELFRGTLSQTSVYPREAE